MENTHNPQNATNNLILSVDTSTKVCSVAIHENGLLLANAERFEENSHAERLALLIKEACNIAKLKLEQLDAFALAKGPGSYTGLRIGSSSLKGLCFALDKPLITLSTLRIMAEGIFQMVDDDTLVCPMIDARRMEVYTAVYDAKGNTILPEQAMIVDENSFLALLSQNKILFGGNGAEKCKPIFSSKNALFASDCHPLAKNMGQLAFHSYKANQFADLAYFEPEYLKEFYTTARTKS
jgi:tRNA threonylcarbamoyladenosine biosynthesis protein TsaB